MPDLKLLQISDTHVLSDTEATLYRQNVLDNVRAVVETAASIADYDAVILTGDLSNDETDASYERLADALSPLRCPNIMAIPGNHDDPVLLEERFLTTPYNSHGWSILPVSSHWPGHVEGLVEDGVLEDLRQSLEQATQENRYVVVAVHHPPHYPCNNQTCSLTEPQALTSVLDRDCVRLVISGHVHDDYLTLVNNAMYSTAPSTCAGFDHNPAGHRMSILSPGAIAYTLHESGQVSRHAFYL